MDTSKKIIDFFAKYPERKFDKREIMVRAERELPGIFYITDGRVSQYDITPAGDEVVVNVFKPGAFFPMSVAINRTPNNYYFEASTKVVARLAPAEQVVQFLKDNPDVLYDLLSRVYRGMDGILRRMAHMMGGDAKSRMMFELINAANRFGEQQSSGAVVLQLKESDLARHSGLSRETISRTVRELKASGLVEVQRGGLIIKDLKRLESTLGSDL